MVKRIMTTLWVIIFFTTIGVGVFFGMISPGSPYYTSSIVVGAMILLLGCPMCLIDSKISSKRRLKEKDNMMKTQLMEKEKQLQLLEYEKSLELKEKELEIRSKQLSLQEKDLEINALLSAREELTEDDIRVSKEQHNCLVHKGPITGYSYICPKCGAFYCIKCAEAIKQIENACWSCGYPLDTTLPVKSGLTHESSEKEDPHKIKQNIFCPQCGAQFKRGTIFCGECGAQLEK